MLAARLEQLTGAVPMWLSYDPFLRLRRSDWFFNTAANTNERICDIDRSNLTGPQYRRCVQRCRGAGCCRGRR